MAGNVAIAWVITLPCAGLVGAVYAEIAKLPGGTLIIYALVAAAVAGMIAHAPAGCSAPGRRRCRGTRRPRRRRSADAPEEAQAPPEALA